MVENKPRRIFNILPYLFVGFLAGNYIGNTLGETKARKEIKQNLESVFGENMARSNPEIISRRTFLKGSRLYTEERILPQSVFYRIIEGSGEIEVKDYMEIKDQLHPLPSKDYEERMPVVNPDNMNKPLDSVYSKKII